MLRNKRESIEWLEFEIFQEFPQIAHAIFLKHGGASVASSNGALFKKVLKCSSLVGAHQVHGAAVKEAPMEEGDDKCDALYTQKDGVALLIKHADCQAAIVYDPMLKIIANVHAGWRGNVQNIYQRVVDELKSRFGSKPENLIVGISPSLGPCCAEFINYKTEFPEPFWHYQAKPLYFDLWEISRTQWREAGVLPHHLQIAGICTCCNKEDYFSYRRDKSTGRHGTVIYKCSQR